MLPNKEDPKVQLKLKEMIGGWYFFLNDIFGLFGFTLALGSLGTQSPSFYACASLILLAILYAPEYYKRRHLIKALNKEKHYLLSTSNIIRGGMVYWYGFGFLILVAIGKLKSDTSLEILCN